ncbi:MAG: DNA-binding protein AraC-type [Nevskia sp.]|nr:DNA-binding protein AraC-type [Nevskia sp.]
MSSRISLRSASAFQSAFRVEPEVAEETGRASGVGIYGWKTPPMEGFELPETEELIVALHLGGSRRVRAVTRDGLSRSYSVPGLLTILPPGRSSAFLTEGSVSLVSLHIPIRKIIAPGAGELLSRTELSTPRFAFRDAFVSAGMEALLRAARSRQSADPSYVTKVVEALLCHLGRWAVLPGQSSIQIEGAEFHSLGCLALSDLLTYVDGHLGSKLSVNELADKAGLSRAAFTRDFKAAIGVSFHQYLQARRVAAAKKMLCETDLDLAFIAQEQGFSSQSHFTAVFKSLVNCTPQQFRRNH